MPERLVDVLVGTAYGNSLHTEVRVEILRNGKGTISKITEYDEPIDVEIYDNWLFILPEAIRIVRSLSHIDGIDFGSDGKGRSDAVKSLEAVQGREKYTKDVLLYT